MQARCASAAALVSELPAVCCGAFPRMPQR
jgi:hypothetical protein